MHDPTSSHHPTMLPAEMSPYEGGDADTDPMGIVYYDDAPAPVALDDEERRRRVFAQSLSDTFEDRADLDDMRTRFFAAIERERMGRIESPLDLLLLTKRPENILRMVPVHWRTAWPSYVWIGTSVGTRESLKRIDAMRAVTAPILFLSIEPQLEDLGTVDLTGISWVIQGGEYHRDRSKARPFDLEWMWSMKAQCAAAGVAWFPKQIGARPVTGGIPVEVTDSHGADESEWPKGLRGCRAWPEARP